MGKRLLFFVLFLSSFGVNAQCTLTVDINSINNETCAGDGDGSAALVNGATYTDFSWDNITNGLNYGSGPNLASVNNLDPGTYVVTGTNPLGNCTTAVSLTDTFVILAGIDLSISSNIVLPLCYGDPCIVDIFTSQTNGSGWYQYAIEYSTSFGWFTLSQQTTYDTAQFTQIPANSNTNPPSTHYRITVTDTANNLTCFVTETFSVTEPPLLLFSSSAISVDESVLGACDGSISVFVSGGTTPYNFSWVGPSGYSSTNEDIFNLCAGIYNLTLADTNGCSINLIDTVNSPIICDVAVNVMEQVTCPGGNDGVAEITNGSASFQVFSWDNLTDGINYGNGPIMSLSNLVAGLYVVTGTQPTGTCPDTMHSDTFEIIQPTDTIISSLSACGGGSIPILVNVINSKDSVLYSYSIDGNSASFSDSTFSDSLQVGPHYYTIFAIDTSNGFSDTLCSFDTTFFDIIDTSITISINIDSTLVTCIGNDGSITINAVGGGGTLMYSKDGGANYQIDSIFTNLTTGSYNVFVQESGCEQGYANNPVVIDSTSINFVVNSVTTIEESCCGDDGRIILDIDTLGSGGTITYSIDTGNTFSTDDSILTNLTAGNYYVVVKDANGCDTTLGYISISASSTPDIDMSVHITDIVCHGDTNGTFRVLDPDSCYSYALWRYTISPPYYIPVDTGTYFNGLIPGSYGVIATSNTGNCIDSSIAKIIDEPTILIQNGIAVKEVRCSNNDTCDGEITLSTTPTGGIPPYSYSVLDYGNNIPFGPIGSDSTFGGLCTDSFEVTLFDANACKVIDTVFVPDSTLYIDSIITTNVTCFGYGDGTAIVYAHGGYMPYSYTWSNGDSTMMAASFLDTLYFITITDIQNCEATDSVIITQPGELFYNIKVIDGFKLETCKGVSYDGEFHMNYQGGTTPFNWSWIGTSGATGSGFGDTIGNLTFDTLALFVTDSNGCIGQPAWIHADSARVGALNTLNPLILDTIITDSVLCYGTATASIFINIKSGEAAYSYSVDSGLTFTTDSIFTNLPAGNYNIEVQDVFGCAVYSNVSISQVSEIIIFNDSIKHISCYNGTDGYLLVSAEGGYAPYTFLWDPFGSTDNFASNISVGMHTVRVTDSTGCIKVDSFSVVELTLPFASNATVITHVSCHDSANGSATISVQGGMLPYSYAWSSGGNTNVEDSLAAGTYIIEINDSYRYRTTNDSINCGPIHDTVEILQPNEFLLEILSNTPNLCFGDALGELTLTASGGTVPYNQFFTRDEQGNVMMVYVPTISGLTASDYDIWAIDTNGCPSDTLKAVKIGEPGEIEININNLINSTCFQSDDGVLEITLINGTSPYNYELLENGNIMTQGSISQTTLLVFENLVTTSYLLSITDYNNCLKDSIIEITQPNQVIADFTSDNTSGQETFSINLTNNSQGADVFYWDYDDGTEEILGINEIPTHSYNRQGQYEIMLVAENSLLSQNCNDTTFVTIDVQGFDVFNVFSPNDDGVNDIFDFDGWSLSSMHVEVYNRWGEKIYHWDSPNGSWNGKTYNNDDAPDGVYYFYLKANGEDGYLYQQQGSITLLR